MTLFLRRSLFLLYCYGLLIDNKPPRNIHLWKGRGKEARNISKFPGAFPFGEWAQCA